MVVGGQALASTVADLRENSEAEGGKEGWALIERYGFNEPPELDADPDEA
jgi:hypothetical protein